tara:strand:- start:1235 stop:1936 length:702 start_codon:yes stop_codon:yes gene_type:complete
MTEPSAPEFDAYSNDYDKHVNSALGVPGLTVDYFTKVKANYIKDIFRRNFSEIDISVLDLGCGVGNYHPLIKTSVGQLTGVDVSSASIDLARSRNPDVSYSCFDGTDLPFAANTFDAIFAICVYHHVPIYDREALTKSALNSLKPGGLLIIFEHNPQNPLTMRVVNRCEFDRDAVLLKSVEAEMLMRDTGFSDVRSKFILTVPSFNSLSRSIDISLGSLGLGAQYYTVGRANK